MKFKFVHFRQKEMPMDQTKAAMTLGQSAIELWPFLPRDFQEQLFERVMAA